MCMCDWLYVGPVCVVWLGVFGWLWSLCLSCACKASARNDEEIVLPPRTALGWMVWLCSCCYPPFAFLCTPCHCCRNVVVRVSFPFIHTAEHPHGLASPPSQLLLLWTTGSALLRTPPHHPTTHRHHPHHGDDQGLRYAVSVWLGVGWWGGHNWFVFFHTNTGSQYLAGYTRTRRCPSPQHESALSSLSACV